MVDGAWVIDELNNLSLKDSKKSAAEQWNHLSDVDLPELEGDDVMILIRDDIAHLLIHLEVHQGRWDEPIEVKTPWIDPVWKCKPRTLQNNQCKLFSIRKEITLQNQIERF